RIWRHGVDAHVQHASLQDEGPYGQGWSALPHCGSLVERHGDALLQPQLPQWDCYRL
ncbi:unnamed protein product, partial [Closterium sp. NIES-65]